MESAFISATADNPFICLAEAEQRLALKMGPREWLGYRRFNVRKIEGLPGRASIEYVWDSDGKNKTANSYS